MEHERKLPQPIEKAMRFLRLSGLHAEAVVRGKAWIRSKIADLKIDLWLATEHGEGEQSVQVDDIQCGIETLDALLWPSIFDTDDMRGHLLQIAAADLARYALCIAQVNANGQVADHRTLLSSASSFLEKDEAIDEAYKCMHRIEDSPGVVFEDVREVVENAVRLLETAGG